VSTLLRWPAVAGSGSALRLSKSCFGFGSGPGRGGVTRRDGWREGGKRACATRHRSVGDWVPDAIRSRSGQRRPVAGHSGVRMPTPPNAKRPSASLHRASSQSRLRPGTSNRPCGGPPPTDPVRPSEPPVHSGPRATHRTRRARQCPASPSARGRPRPRGTSQTAGCRSSQPRSS
jgi:hypothetical protein